MNKIITIFTIIILMIAIACSDDDTNPTNTNSSSSSSSTASIKFNINIGSSNGTSVDLVEWAKNNMSLSWDSGTLTSSQSNLILNSFISNYEAKTGYDWCIIQAYDNNNIVLILACWELNSTNQIP